MKKSIFYLFINCLVLASSSNSQSVQESFKDLNNCIDIEVEAMKIIPSFYAKKQYDSIELTLDFVNIKCIESESLRMIRLLLAIENKTFTDSTLTDADIFLIKKESKYIRHGHLSDYRHFMMSSSYYNSRFSMIREYGYRSNLESRLIEVLIKWSTNLINNSLDRTSLEFSVLEHIRGFQRKFRKGVNLFREVNKPQHKNSTIRKTYDRYHSNFVLNRAAHLGVGYLSWASLGDARNFYGVKSGMHLNLGYMVSNKDRIDISGDFRFGKSLLPMKINRADTSFFSSNGNGYLVGLDYVRTIWRPNRRFEFAGLIGVGAEGRRVFTLEDSEELTPTDKRMSPDDKEKFAFNLGMEFKYFVLAGAAINVKTRYIFSGNFRELQGVGGSQTNGNSLILNIGFSFFLDGHPYRSFWNMER
ncbi:MAG: hypothetical protein MUE72_12125 [Chitinophagaceae bacterium]|jgi:hypothetical protein|nr:hypothetical protein [Chitinophagaceae bacterium]